MASDDQAVAWRQPSRYMDTVALDDSKLDFTALRLRGIDDIYGPALLHRNDGQQRDKDDIPENPARQTGTHNLST